MNTCKYSKAKVDKAGSFLLDPNKNDWNEQENPYEMIGTFRSSHSFALNSTQNSLRRIVERISKDCLIAQRLKRIPSIVRKLENRKGLRLTQIQDIGGCRAVVNNINDLRKLKVAIENSRFRSRIHSTDNYVANPKNDGYRSIHYTVKYFAPEKYIQFDNQKIEIQIRTKLQHAWATALETVDLFENTNLKSGGGDDLWKKFFLYASSAFSKIEDCASVPNYNYSIKCLQDALKYYYKKLNVKTLLIGYSASLYHIDHNHKNANFILIKLDLNSRRMSFETFGSHELEKATKRFTEEEKQNSGNQQIEIALVSTNSIKNLRKAYPNYFLDTTLFLETLDDFINRPYDINDGIQLELDI